MYVCSYILKYVVVVVFVLVYVCDNMLGSLVLCFGWGFVGGVWFVCFGLGSSGSWCDGGGVMSGWCGSGAARRIWARFSRWVLSVKVAQLLMLVGPAPMRPAHAMW